jgi:hypothetical protein
MLIEKLEVKVKILYFLKQRKRLLVNFGILFLLIYFIFLCPATQFTWERLIDALSRRNPPSWLFPKAPGETVDIQQTKNVKRQKLAQLKKDVYQVQVDLSFLLGRGANQFGDAKPAEVDGVNLKTPWQTFTEDLSSAGFSLVDFWGVTIVTIPGMGQEEEQTLIVGISSKPINLNDQVLRWQQEIEAAADRYHLKPELIAAVMEQESGGDPEALSLAGAIGLMQLMPATADQMNVNPYDPAQNIEGGAHYLKIQLDQFGGIQPALAAYNAGPGNVQNGDWIKIPETLNYIEKVPRLLTKYERLWKENQVQ